MPVQSKKLHFGLGLIPPEGSDPLDVNTFVHIAQTAERGKIDSLFLADGVWLDPETPRDQARGHLEPLTLLSALATATEHIGLSATASTTFYDPYNLARLFASLDHLSRGRAGWNMVTSSAGEANFGIANLPPQDERYERAEEFVDVVVNLWRSWDRTADSNLAIGGIDHRGKHFQVSGPLNVPPSPQHGAVLVQAGSSDAGREFGARHAEAIFTATQGKSDSKAFYNDIKTRASQHGRSPEEIIILPGANLYIAESDSAAQHLYQEKTEQLDYDRALPFLERSLGGVNLRGLSLDQPIPPDRLIETGHLLRRQSRPGLFRKLALEGASLRKVIQVAAFSSGHLHVVGGPERIADQLIDWFEDGAADGFNLVAGFGTGSLDAIVDGLIPLLQRRGYFRTEYRGTTFRDNLRDNS